MLTNFRPDGEKHEAASTLMATFIAVTRVVADGAEIFS
jgi:hypothetical protein